MPQCRGWNLSLKAWIRALSLEYEPLGFELWDWIFSFEAGNLASRLVFESQHRDLGLKTGIRTSRLRFGPQGTDFSLEAPGGREFRRRRRRDFYIWESIGLRLLLGYCPEAASTFSHACRAIISATTQRFVNWWPFPLTKNFSEKPHNSGFLWHYCLT